MATSARFASLREYRTLTKRKVLTPGSLGSTAQSIARKSLDAEFDSMVNRYNDGTVSNDEFLAFLQKSVVNPYFTQSEKVGIQDKINDFQTRVDVEKMQAVYDNASGQDKVTAAKNIADYYTQYAQSLMPDTPAYSQALQNQAKWANQAVNQQDMLNKADRQLKRYQVLNEASQKPSDTLEGLQAKYDAYVKIAQEAYNDGQEAEGLRYETMANEIANTKYPKMQEALQNKDIVDQKKDLDSRYSQVVNAYHDGQATAQDVARTLREIDVQATQIGYDSLVNKINTIADKLQLDIERGITRGDVEGLPYFRRNTKNGDQLLSIKQMRAVFQNEDDIFAQEKMNIMKNPNAYERIIQLGILYSAYLYGMAPSNEDPSGWMGLVNRGETIDQWGQLIPENAASYENTKRDQLTKQMRIENDYQPILAQLESIPADVQINGQPVADIVNSILSGVSSSLIVPPTMGNNYGILVSYDASGRPYEKMVPLNQGQITETDPVTGVSTTTSTMVGQTIAKTSDGKYIKLQSHFPSGVEPIPGNEDFMYGEYNGQIMVKDAATGDLMPASQLAQSDPYVAEWYKSQQANEAERMQRYQALIAPIGPQKPAILPQNQPVPTPPPTDQIIPATTFEASQLKPEFAPLPYTPRSDIGRGLGQADMTSPKYDLDLSGYNLPYSLPQTNLQPSYYQTPTTTYQDIPQDTLYNAGVQPQNNLQKALPQVPLNQNIPLKITPYEEKPGLLSQVGTGVKNAATGVWNFLKKINPF